MECYYLLYLLWIYVANVIDQTNNATDYNNTVRADTGLGNTINDIIESAEIDMEGNTLSHLFTNNNTYKGLLYLQLIKSVVSRKIMLSVSLLLTLLRPHLWSLIHQLNQIHEK